MEPWELKHAHLRKSLRLFLVSIFGLLATPSLRVEVSRVWGQDAQVFGINGRKSREMFVRRNIPFDHLRVEILRALRTSERSGE